MGIYAGLYLLVVLSERRTAWHIACFRVNLDAGFINEAHMNIQSFNYRTIGSTTLRPEYMANSFLDSDSANILGGRAYFGPYYNHN